MLISFYSSGSINRGSYRIHVRNLCEYFKNLGYKSVIGGDPNKYEVLIHDKLTNKINNLDKVNGIITPSCDNTHILNAADFIIVGSIEEKCSMMKHNKNVFLFPQIEKMYINIPRKIHEYIPEDKPLIIGYHGNQNHLNHSVCGLKTALERLSKERKIKFVYICQNDKEWIEGRPQGVDMEFKRWKYETITKEIQNFDIGVVPNISEVEHSNRLKQNITLGKYNTDMKIRFKNKSNIGRSLVFFNLGIPVVADITPANMHILADPDNGYGVLDENSWYWALKELCCEKRRNFISENAYIEANRLYNPEKWTKSLAESIKKVHKEKMEKMKK
tara:strand:+ start:2632 stop:3624 length:993 start_codon:yes stop_codon:yes gene_type:complete